MSRIKFEHKITFAYLLVGGLWILFSDNILDGFIKDKNLLTDFQTFKGWFYVLITAILFFLFLKKHLNRLRNTEKELENHKKNLEQMVDAKTMDLDKLNQELTVTNSALHHKNEIIIRQNSELQETLDDLRDTQAQLIQADKMASIGILTAGIAHEINNPLNYILGGCTGLENHFNEEQVQDEDVNLYLNSIKTGIERVNSIVTGITKFSREKDVYDEDCDIHEILENCLTIVHHELKGRIKVEKKYAEESPIVMGNVGQLHQVFINILINAVQAIENAGKINIETYIKEEKVFTEITDTGCGIEAQYISRVTDPFFTTKEPGKGTGLGLSISYNIIREHKGDIFFISELNKGTTVKVFLPLKK
ncbi:MAG: ATP-binding protein [Draconibacterium sp.]